MPKGSSKADALAKKIVEGVQLHRQGKLKDAWSRFQDVLKIEPFNFSAMHSMGLIAVQMKSYVMAIELFQMALSVEPKNAMVFNNLANAFLKLDQTDQALVNYNKALGIDPEYVDQTPRVLRPGGTQNGVPVF